MKGLRQVDFPGKEGLEYLKCDSNELKDMYKNMNEFKKCYQNRISLVEYGKGDMLANSHTLVKSWNKHCC